MWQQTGQRVALVWLTLRTSLYEDLRRLIFVHASSDRCVRCGVATETPRRIHTCFFRGERLCFVCHHRARWPATSS